MSAPAGRDELALMRRALALAARGRGGTSPNPMVGAVIVKDGVILGEGWHHRAGGPHAEIEALRAAGDVRGATMIVTLEPCCHHGRTGPCTQAVIAAGIARVVVGALDPNPLVAGKGLDELRAAGLEVEHGVLGDEARALNHVFDKWIVTRRPWVTLKLATSLDGRIAARVGERTDVTGPAVWQRVQAMRAAADAVMVGVGTARVDRPRLTVRSEVPNAEFLPPWRILVDSHLGFEMTPLFLAGAPGVIIATTVDDARTEALRARGVEVIVTPGPRVDLAALVQALGARQPPVTSVLCEGGAELATSLLEGGLVDELVMFVAPRAFGPDGVPAFSRALPLDGFTLAAVEPLDGDVALTYRPRSR